jgi:LmbE family N-acetylglucosaminyl deacetylase
VSETRRRVAGVWAHPDDDSYSMAGTYLRFGPDIDLTLVIATSGGAGLISAGSAATRETLAEVREREEREALRRAGVESADVRWLRYPDGELEAVPGEELVDAVAGILEERRPEVVVTFGPRGVTKHPDHIRIGEVATAAFHRLRDRHPSDGSFAALLYGEVSQVALDRFYDELRRRGQTDIDPDAPFMPEGVPDETIAVVVDCRDVLDRKLDVIRAHATQMDELDVTPPDLRELLFSHESFVQAWPPRDPGRPVRHELVP